MNITSAPAQLPLAPRPLADELISSWLMRTAAANAVSFKELITALEMHDPQNFVSGIMLDYSVPETTLRALSRFTRVPYSRLNKLDLNVRVPQINEALLLRFPQKGLSSGCSCGRAWRLRYAFCPQCVSSQKTFHIRWDWCFAALLRCSVHRSPLMDRCPQCGEIEPLSFSLPTTLPSLVCRSCSKDLAQRPKEHNHLRDNDIIAVVETAYRSSLLEMAWDPRQLGSAKHRAFRGFIEDMLEMLIVVLSPPSDWSGGFLSLSLPRQSLLEIIAGLVRNATETNDPKCRNARYRRSLLLWSSLFQVLSEQGEKLERCSRYWPSSLRRRFATALEHRCRNRWPHNPYPAQALALRFKYNTLAAVFGLSAMRAPKLKISDLSTARQKETTRIFHGSGDG